jgi:hypothetical protein
MRERYQTAVGNGVSVNVLDSAWGACDMGRFVPELDLEFSDELVPAFTGQSKNEFDENE